MSELAIRTGKLSFKEKASYGIGIFSDSIPFNIICLYFLYYMTDVAGINPALAGTISLIAITWDAITDPIVGYLSDNWKSKNGRRRPFMIVGAIPEYLVLMLIFAPFTFSGNSGFAYYLIVAILFWTAYKTYVIPYTALGAEITQDFNERNSLRSYCGIFIYIAVWIASAGPMAIMDRVFAYGGTEKMSWSISAAIFGAVGLIGALTCWRFTRGKELIENNEERIKTNLYKNFVELYKIKPFRMIFFATLFFCINFSIASAAFVYLMSNNLGLDAGVQATYWTLNTVISLIYVPVITFVANRIGKKYAFICFFLIGIIGSLTFAVIGINDFSSLIIFTIVWNAANICFWTTGFSMIYDCCEADELINGERREGAISGFTSFAQKFGSAFGLWLSGVILSFTGYNGEVIEQTESALKGINLLNTLVPAIFMLIALAFIIRYPLNAKNFEALIKALELKREGKEYSTEGFEKLV
ncbi:MFS transporter [Clostridiales bacterium BAD-6]|uniref:MFS transporter n=2 Tax=Sinanaerobacter chloroacetimidivorans TaxID=2818044 RepID=A0A8J7VYB4_9FIRM|nr:MFS transporter [Sinanaerobacter chloroacetimidivorans]